MSKLLKTHRRLLEHFRASMNLIGPGPAAFHYEDCRLALEGFNAEGDWADLGTGAGFPGVPFAVQFRKVRLDLIDSRRKRCVFLEMVIGESGEDPARVRVRCMRLEEVEACQYDGVIARALAKPDVALNYACRLLKPGGRLLLLLLEDQPVPQSDDFVLEESHSYVVQDKARKRVVLRKRAEAL